VAAAPVVQTPATKDAAAMQNAFAEVSKAVEPAVVTITTERALPRPAVGRRNPSPFGGPGDPFGGEDPFEEFFKRFRNFQPNFQPNSSAKRCADVYTRFRAVAVGLAPA